MESSPSLFETVIVGSSLHYQSICFVAILLFPCLLGLYSKQFLEFGKNEAGRTDSCPREDRSAISVDSICIETIFFKIRPLGVDLASISRKFINIMITYLL